MKDNLRKLSRRDMLRALGVAAAGTLAVGLPLERKKDEFNTQVTPEEATEILSFKPWMIVHRSANEISSIGQTTQIDYQVGLDGDLRQVRDNLALLHGYSLGPFALETDPRELKMGWPNYLEDMFPLFPQNNLIALEIKEQLDIKRKALLIELMRKNNPSRIIIHSSKWAELDSIRRLSGHNDRFYYQLGSVEKFEEGFMDPNQLRKGLWGRPEFILPFKQPCEYLGIDRIGDVRNPQEALTVCRDGTSGFIADFKVVQAITRAAASRLG